MSDSVKDVVVNGVYRHFKGHEVKVLAVAEHTETGDFVVVYQHLYDGKVWARPVEMFTSEVDTAKYPNATQIHRFELLYVD